MENKPNYSEWRRSWWRETVGDLRESRALLPEGDHSRAVNLASGYGVRLPILLGQLVTSQLAQLDERSEQPANQPIPAKDYGEGSCDIGLLSRLIVASDFPEDTASTRLRQLGLVHIIASDREAGRKSTARDVSLRLRAPSTQIDLLCRVLDARGILSRVRVPGVHPGKSAKILMIRDDAVEAFKKAHRETVGKEVAPE
ncbi:hypothetical protein [Agrobacterium tumefaciens]|uniref:hypothetical protein n=1 Tax=Agrobacterium tumefaciens TaxID=358 RepID=UPI0021D31933|nr:hypothetical protein [Agrobacterium tumefaciens]UXS05578.1 hypothetical protein FY156_29075 [Agrobacterium tumefaciens]